MEQYLYNKKVLLISPEPWNHIFVSKHHYAIYLVRRGNHVFFLNPPRGRWNVMNTEYTKLQVIDYPGFVIGFKYLPGFIRRFYLRLVFNKIEKISAIKFDIVWSFDNSVFYDFNAFESVLKICHIVDLNQDFQTKKAAQNADICFYNTRFLGEKMTHFNVNSYFVNHGFSNDLFDCASEPVKIEGHGRIKIGYAGNLDISYIDWNLLEEVIYTFNDAEFYFAGSCHEKAILEFFEKTDNVFFLGRLTKSQLSYFYMNMDVLIIVYRADEFRMQLSNPHKMMEYLGSGKPIVATYTEEYVELKDIICMSESNKDWPATFGNLLDNLEYYNSSSMCQKRVEYAMANTYSKQIDRIEEYLASIQK